MDRTLEPKTLQSLVKLYGATRSVEIYNEFVFDYKAKHFGEIEDNKDHVAINDWYQKRGETFARFVNRYYLRGK